MRNLTLCFILLYVLLCSIPSKGQSWNWTNRTFSSAITTRGIGIDNAQNIFMLLSENSGSVTIDSFTTIGNNNFNIIKLDSSGHVFKMFESSSLISQAGYCFVSGIEVSNNGNLILRGRTESPIVIAQDTFAPVDTGINDYGFIIVLDSAFNYIKGKCFCNNSEFIINDITTDANENIYLAGKFSGELATEVDTLNAQGIDGIILKYDSVGNYLTSKVFNDSAGACLITQIEKEDVTGRIGISGWYYGSAQFDTIMINNPTANSNGFIASLDMNMNVEWAKDYVEAYDFNDYAKLAMSPNGNLLISGSYYSDTLFIEDTSFVNLNVSDIYLASYNNAGYLNWIKKEGGIHEDRVNDIEVDRNNNITIVGSFPGAIFLGNGTIFACGSQGLFISRYDNEGDFLYSYSNEGCGDTEGNYVSIDNNSNILIAGNFSEELIINGDSLISLASRNSYIAKLNTSTIPVLIPENFTNDFTIFPNPSNGTFYLNRESDIKDLEIEIVDVLGNIIKSESIRIEDNEDYYTFNLNVRGLYFLRLTTSEKHWNAKLIVR